MNFMTFPVSTTNVFPAANSTTGSQLVTEFNLRSRETVATDEEISYEIGPSYCHAESDFFVRIQQDGAGTIISSTVLEILPGRAVINGHYVENTAHMLIDLAEANAKLQLEKLDPLRGDLEVGLRIMYSTLPTMAGAIRVENQENLWEGIQVVILPKLTLPEDAPDSPHDVTAHIRLASFKYLNNQLTVPFNFYPEKCQCYPASRIKNVEDLAAGLFVSKHGLNPHKIYTLSGKGLDTETMMDSWCDSTGALMIWDHNPQISEEKPSVDLRESMFIADSSGKVNLVMPHMQIDGMTNTYGVPLYFQPKSIPFPSADFDKGTSGTVDKNYSRRVKDMMEKINNLYRLPYGRQVWYTPVLESRDGLPVINPAWKIGDYILVGEDMSIDMTESDMRSPATLYVILPGVVKKIAFVETREDEQIPASLTGVEISRTYGSVAASQVEKEFMEYWSGIKDGEFIGAINTDYFLYIRETDQAVYRTYYKVTEAGPYDWSDAVWLTQEIPLAQESTIGGFYNVSDSALDQGYVYRDLDGHLRILDYELLRTGVLAYQLGEDFISPGGLATAEVQTYLDEYVNERVAFPNINHLAKASNPNVIEISLDLVAEDERTEINIHDIDSRFGTSILLRIRGDANANTVINISNCEKIRIANDIGGEPTINLYRCNIWYDSVVLNTLNEIIDMRLWYERFEETDPSLMVQEMTVMETGAPSNSQSLEFWETIRPNDIHYMYALRSLTFSGDGTIIGMSLYVKNDTTANIVDDVPFISVAEFLMPNGYGLQYPEKRMTRKLKVTGTFVTAYVEVDPPGYKIMKTNFSALTGVYDRYDEDAKKYLKGTIAFYTEMQHVAVPAELSNAAVPEELRKGIPIDPWETSSYHIFSGGVLE